VRRRNRLTLIAVLLVFLVPIFVAKVLYRSVSETGPSSTSNQGVLVSPARPLGEVALVDPDGVPIDARVLLGRWTLLHVESATCEEACRRNVYNTRQVRILLNKEMSRVQRLMIAPDGYGTADVAWLRQNHPTLVLATGSREDLEGLFARLEVGEPPAGVSDHRTYLVDPHGNFMMWYPADQDPKGVLKDLQKLLKVSQIG